MATVLPFPLCLQVHTWQAWSWLEVEARESFSRILHLWAQGPWSPGHYRLCRSLASLTQSGSQRITRELQSVHKLAEQRLRLYAANDINFSPLLFRYFTEKRRTPQTLHHPLMRWKSSWLFIRYLEIVYLIFYLAKIRKWIWYVWFSAHHPSSNPTS